MTQRIIEIDSPNFIPENRLAAAGGIEEFFDNDNPLALEIGCGIGDFILQLAPQKPHLNFLAIDIYNKGCYKTCKKIDRAGFDNVKVMRIEARYLLARYLRPESLAAIYINCPDPWPKKRHRDRRLVTREFLQTALHYLQPEADLFFSSDFSDYAQQVAGLHPTVTGFRNCLAAPCETVPPEYPKSKYMRRFLEKNQPIYFIHCRKSANPTGAALPVPPVKPGFRTPWSTVGHD
jgi:tRNA (guanine-N7-)-methyltransferase